MTLTIVNHKVSGPAGSAPPLRPRRDTAFRSILLVEDNPTDADCVQELLASEKAHGLEVVHVTRLADALDHVAEHQPWYVLLDLSLPDAEETEGLVHLRAVAPEVPIVVLTGRVDEATRTRALQCGAHDYVVKGNMDAALLGKTMRYAEERKHSGAELCRAALYDALTGLPNRTLFLDRVAHGIARLRREHCLLAVCSLDLGGSRAINDAFGQIVGAQLLEQVADRLLLSTRPGDTVARLGGDEFVILLESVARDANVPAVVERICTVLTEPFVIRDRAVQIDASVGIALARGPDDQPWELVDEAAAAMHEAKRASKREVTVAHD